MPQGRPTPARLRVWRDIERQYRARQPDVAREGRAALLTAGAPGAGKSTAVTALGIIDQRWRRLDADVVKDYLVAELVETGEADDVLREVLEDGRPVMPRELAGLIHNESVAILDMMRRRSLRDGENVVVEGTLAWEPAAQTLLKQLVDAQYREVTIVDVEVRVEVAREQALQRWWTGRHDTADPLGGRWTPLVVIERAYPDAADPRSICARNARSLFDSQLTAEVETTRLTVVDHTGAGTTTETHERHVGVLQQRPAQLVIPEPAAAALDLASRLTTPGPTAVASARHPGSPGNPATPGAATHRDADPPPRGRST